MPSDVDDASRPSKRTTVSLAVIMFELTDTLTYAVPVMLSVLVAKTVADSLEPKGIYDLVIELNQLPYLDSKHEYLWGSLQINDVVSSVPTTVNLKSKLMSVETVHDVEVIRLDGKNTVESLRDQLLTLTASGSDDDGFPILRNDSNGDGLRMVGYIGANELEHALSDFYYFDHVQELKIADRPTLAGVVADHEEEEVHFHTTYSHNLDASSTSSLPDGLANPVQNPFDFSIYMDQVWKAFHCRLMLIHLWQAPLTIQSNSPLEMVQQFFVKLGARYVIVTDPDGRCTSFHGSFW